MGVPPPLPLLPVLKGENVVVTVAGGSPPCTYEATIRLGLEDPRNRADLGYWPTIVTSPMVFAELTSRVIEEVRAKGITG